MSARRADWFILRCEDNRDATQEKLFARLCQQPELSAAITLAQDFMALVRQRLPKKLDDWLDKAKNSSIKAFENFAQSLEDEYDAVKAGVTLEISNGTVEGQNNRLTTGPNPVLPWATFFAFDGFGDNSNLIFRMIWGYTCFSASSNLWGGYPLSSKSVIVGILTGFDRK